MGGLGSGSWRGRGAGRCESQHRIDLAYMRRSGLLGPYCRGSLRWSSGGEPTGDICYSVAPDHLRLDYRARPCWAESWESVTEKIPFTWTDTAFGGRRRWLVCLSCERRCRIIYGDARFRCRKCHRLTNQSQHEPAWQRPLTRAQNVRIRLGGDGGMDGSFPPKPKGMHWRTYRRLEAQDEVANHVWEAAMAGKLTVFLELASRRTRRDDSSCV